MKIEKYFLSVLLFLSFIFAATNAFTDQVDDLVAKAKSDQFDSYYYAIVDLGGIDSEKAVSALVKIMLGDPQSYKRSQAAEVLKDIQKDKIQLVIKPLLQAAEKDSSADVKRSALHSIFWYYEFDEYKDPAPLPYVITALNDTDSYTRSQAAEVLESMARQAGIKDEKALPILMKMAVEDSDNWSTRTAAIKALETYGDPRGVEPIIKALDDKDAFARARAADSLGRIKDKRAKDPLIKKLKDPDSEVREAALNALKELGFTEQELQSKTLKGKDALEACVKELEGGYDITVAKKALDAVKDMKQLPPVPEEAKKSMARGIAAVKIAKAQGDYEAAAAEFKQGIQKAPWWPDLYYNLGLVEEKLKHYYDAKDLINLYISNIPEGPDAEKAKSKVYEIDYYVERSDKANEHLNAGNDYFDSQQYESAIYEYKEALKSDPTMGIAYNNMGCAYQRLDKNQEAAENIEKAIEMGYKDPWGYLHLGYVYGQMGMGEDVQIKTYEEGISSVTYSTTSETVGHLHYNLGSSYQRKGDVNKAIENYQKAIDKGYSGSQEAQNRINSLR